MRALALSMVAGLVFIVSGCGGDGLPKPVPAGGKITLNGNPVEGALVTFHSKGGSGRSATGKTGPDGTFKLTTVNTNDGAAPGDYLITVAKQTAKDGSSGGAIDINAGGDPGAAYAAAMASAGSNKPDKNMQDAIPAKYGNANESGLSRTIVKGEANDFTFDLE